MCSSSVTIRSILSSGSVDESAVEGGVMVTHKDVRCKEDCASDRILSDNEKREGGDETYSLYYATCGDFIYTIGTSQNAAQLTTELLKRMN